MKTIEEVSNKSKTSGSLWEAIDKNRSVLTSGTTIIYNISNTFIDEAVGKDDLQVKNWYLSNSHFFWDLNELPTNTEAIAGISKPVESLSINEQNDQDLKYFKKKYTNELIQLIKTEDFEYGFISESQELILKLMRKNKFALMEFLSDILTQNFNSPQIVLGIIRCLGALDNEEITKTAYTIVATCINYRNIEVQDASVRALESWGTFEALELLRLIKVEPDWLKEYVHSVINGLTNS